VLDVELMGELDVEVMGEWVFRGDLGVELRGDGC
jgi:hypothetical protein